MLTIMTEDLTCTFTSTSAQATKRLAALLAPHLEPDDVIVFSGGLGAGKTQFTQGLARGLGITAPVVSPTFNLVLEYAGGRLPLFHFDWYRLTKASELEDIGFFDLLEAGGLRMDAQVALNSMTITGDAPSGRLELLLKALVNLANGRTLNRAEFQAFAANEQLRDRTLEDELMLRLNPGYAYTRSRDPQVLSAETQEKAERFFAERFARMNDGVLILAGDLSEEQVKRLLTRYLGNFSTGKGATPRKAVELTLPGGTSTYTGTGPEKGIFLLQSAEYADVNAMFARGGVQTVASYAEAFRQLEADKCDAVICDISYFAYQDMMKVGMFANIVTLSSEHYAVGFAKDNPDAPAMIAEINRAFKQLDSDGQIRVLCDKYAAYGANYGDWCA